MKKVNLSLIQMILVVINCIIKVLDLIIKVAVWDKQVNELLIMKLEGKFRDLDRLKGIEQMEMGKFQVRQHKMQMTRWLGWICIIYRLIICTKDQIAIKFHSKIIFIQHNKIYKICKELKVMKEY